MEIRNYSHPITGTGVRYFCVTTRKIAISLPAWHWQTFSCLGMKEVSLMNKFLRQSVQI
jgi:hypothetical protein